MIPFLDYLVSGFVSIRQVGYLWMGEGFNAIDSLLAQALAWLPKTRTSHPISKLLRPWFEHRRVRGVLGFNLAALVLLVGLVDSPVAASSAFMSNATLPTEPALVYSQPVVTITERRFQMPVSPSGISQGFQQFHPGVDLQAPLGSAIRPIASGVVSEVMQSRFGYGTALVVSHAEGYASLYAHLKRVFVEKGASVDQEMVMAEVGMSGTTTGPHLHLEIYKQGIPTNPQVILGY